MSRDQELVELLRREGHVRRDVPFELASGELSFDYIDGKRALAEGVVLALACDAVISRAKELKVDFDAVGGLHMGADAIAHGVAIRGEVKWFSVRKEPKLHGKQKLVEGAELSSRSRVLLVEDVVTTGSSMLKALEAVKRSGAEVVLAISLVDRGERARPRLDAEGVRYMPLMTYRDLGIEPVGGIGSVEAARLLKG